MSVNDVKSLAALIHTRREALLTQWRNQVRRLPNARDLDAPTINDHVPDLIDELAAALQMRSTQTIPEEVLAGGPPAHGLQRLRDGFDIEEVVAEYNILRGCIHDLAESNQLALQGESFLILNRVLDGAIGSAVKAYAAQRAIEIQQRRDEYLAFVAHDLRTPLNAISLATKVLELKLPAGASNTDTVQMLKILTRNVQNLEVMVAKVLEENTAVLEEAGAELQRRTVDLWPLVEALTRDLNPVAGAAGTALINRVPDDLSVFADASALRRILENLISNAIRYAPKGEVVIGAKSVVTDGSAEAWVSDNGAGIPAADLEGVFDKLETDPNMEGTSGLGLGLAIVKTFVEAHGGTVTVESKEGYGSTFRFTISASR